MKLFAIAPEGGDVLASRQMSNRSLHDGPYPHVDVDRIWTWLLETLSTLAHDFRIAAIVPCTCGSTVGLVDEDGLVLPMMDYEAEPPADIPAAYAEVAPQFSEVACPVNPACLTLGRQLFWQARDFADAFSRVRWILPAAQYWAWRLCGVPACEVTALSAQTQLWRPGAGGFTKMAMDEGWDALLPALRRPFDTLGPLDEAIASKAGMDQRPPVLTGIHDSNANYARYLAAGLKQFTLISSGTWLITFDTDLPIDRLDPERDMVANTDLEGRPVACTRFMGGREFFAIAGEDGLRARPVAGDLQTVVDQGVMALPSFTDSGGPFPGLGGKGRIEGTAPRTPAEKAALAALYTALVSDVDLDLLASAGDIIIDGSFAENALYAGLLAGLRPDQTVSVSKAPDGTALGASLLWGWAERTEPIDLDLEPATPIRLKGLDSYKARWRRLVDQG